MRKLQYMLPYLKIDVIYEYKIHSRFKKQAAQQLGLNYSTVLAVIQQYLEQGRIFKLLPVHSKVFLLKSRAKNVGY